MSGIEQAAYETDRFRLANSVPEQISVRDFAQARKTKAMNF